VGSLKGAGGFDWTIKLGDRGPCSGGSIKELYKVTG